MNIFDTKIPELLILEPRVFEDDRGWFMESFNQKNFTTILNERGFEAPNFVQDNHSRSQRGVLRGLHFQRTRPQGKLISVSRGSVFDVIVDINPQSATFGEYVALELNDENHLQMWIPAGYAHGFCVLSDVADLHYKCTDFYDPEDEGGLIWNDPDVNIAWPLDNPLLSEKDQKLPRLRELK